MTNEQQHIIRKQVIDLQYYGRSDGFVLQRQVTGWCHQELATAIEEQFNRLPDTGHVYTIDRLEIEIDIDATGNWLAKATEQIARQLNNRLSAEMNKAEATSPGKLPKTRADHFLETLLFYLQYGHLPWWSPVTTKAAWQEELEDLLQKGVPQPAKNRLLEIIQQENVQQRIIYQLPVPLFIKLMLQLRPGIEQELVTITADIRQWLLQSGAEDKKTVMTRFMKPVMAIFMKSVLTAIQESNAERCMENILTDFVQRLSREGWIQQLPASIMDMRSARLKKAIQLHEKKQYQQDTESGKVSGKEDSVQKNKELENELQEGIYINNAGLVIVAAFLPAFFKKLELLQDNELADPDKAVALVQYMASGRERVAEFELGLARILCGLEPDTPVDTDIILTGAEKHEINELLLSVIEYWDILKDTSIEGLRESFLQRDGRLRFVNNEWLLHIEQQGYDVLLQNLPWSIGMIKLPWMKNMLKTEWVE